MGWNQNGGGAGPALGTKVSWPFQFLELHSRFYGVPSSTVQASRVASDISGHTAFFFCVRPSFASPCQGHLRLHLGVCAHHKTPNVITSLNSLEPYKQHSQGPGIRIFWGPLFSLSHIPSFFP